MDQKYQVSQNIFYNFLGQFVLLAISLFSTPFIIHKLGNELYGIYSILTVVVGYFSVLDLGLGSSIIKYISEYSAKDEKDKLEKIIGTALTAYISIGILGGLLIVLFTKIIVTQFLHIPMNLIPLALSVFYISALGFFVTMVLTVFNSIPSGLQRMDISNSRSILLGTLNTIGVVGLLFLGWGLMAIIIWNILVSIVASLIFIKVITKLSPGVSLRPRFDLKIMIKLLNFGGFKFISNIAGQAVFQADRFLIGLFAPIAAVTFYTAPLLLVQKGFSALLNITDAVFPAVSFSHGLAEGERIKQLYIRMSRLITFLIIPILAILFIFSKSILNLWLGTDFGQNSSSILKILCLAYFFMAASASGVIIAEGVGQPRLPALFASISAAINLIAALILIPTQGAVGAAWALLINGALQVPAFIFLVNKKIAKVSHLEYLKLVYLKPFISLILSIIIVELVLSIFGNDNWFNLILDLLIFDISYLLINFLLKTFNEQDKQAFFFIVKKITRLINL